MSLPPKGRRSLDRFNKVRRRTAKAAVKCGVEAPEIFVKRPGEHYGYRRYSPAKIRVRKGCYRYLVWRDGERKREFYLGKIRECTPQTPAAGTRTGAAAAGARARRAGVRK